MKFFKYYYTFYPNYLIYIAQSS